MLIIILIIVLLIIFHLLISCGLFLSVIFGWFFLLAILELLVVEHFLDLLAVAQSLHGVVVRDTFKTRLLFEHLTFFCIIHTVARLQELRLVQSRIIFFIICHIRRITVKIRAFAQSIRIVTLFRRSTDSHFFALRGCVCISLGMYVCQTPCIVIWSINLVSRCDILDRTVKKT